MEYSTEKLLGVDRSVIVAIESTMVSKDARRLYIAILNMRLNDTVDDHMSDLFKYRKKSIKHFEDKDKELL